MQLYTSLQFGDLASIAILDNRQYRSNQPCSDEHGRGHGGRRIVDCEARLAPEQSMLGKRQEAWLGSMLRGSNTQWRVIAQQQMLADLDGDAKGEGKDVRWSDGWGGYAAARRRILALIDRREIENVVVLGGDIHQFWVNDLKLNNADEASPVLATEFVGTSVTSSSSNWALRHLPQNPHARFHAWKYRGYMSATISKSQWQTELHAARSVADPAAEVFTLKRFEVDSGKAGAREV
jgi:alkaline phosphatase D